MNNTSNDHYIISTDCVRFFIYFILLIYNTVMSRKKSVISIQHAVLLSLHKQKKTLREQWLMDGLSTQSEEEQESVKAQTEDFQQKTKLLQSNIDR